MFPRKRFRSLFVEIVKPRPLRLIESFRTGAAIAHGCDAYEDARGRAGGPPSGARDVASALPPPSTTPRGESASTLTIEGRVRQPETEGDAGRPRRTRDPVLPHRAHAEVRERDEAKRGQVLRVGLPHEEDRRSVERGEPARDAGGGLVPPGESARQKDREPDRGEAEKRA